MRYIDADAFEKFDYDIFDGQLSEDAVQGMYTILTLIDKAPTADVAPVVHGHWIDRCVRDWHCSVCNAKVPKQVRFDGYSYDDKLKFCPNCGADMMEI